MREVIVISTLLSALALAAMAAHADLGTVDLHRAGEGAAEGVGRAADGAGDMRKKVFGPGESGRGEKQEDK